MNLKVKFLKKTIIPFFAPRNSTSDNANMGIERFPELMPIIDLQEMEQSISLFREVRYQLLILVSHSYVTVVIYFS